MDKERIEIIIDDIGLAIILCALLGGIIIQNINLYNALFKEQPRYMVKIKDLKDMEANDCENKFNGVYIYEQRACLMKFQDYDNIIY